MIIVPIPRKIQVGGFTYRIECDARARRELSRNNNYGETSEPELNIRLSTKLPPQVLSETFLHETLHVVNCIYCNHALSEEHVHSLSHGLAQVMEGVGVRFL